MKVQVRNHYDGTTRTVEGTPQAVEFELLRSFPFLRSEDPEDQGDVRALVEHLNTVQALDAEVLEQGPVAKAESPASNLRREGERHVLLSMLGHNSKVVGAFDAAKFLCGGAPRTLEQVRRALHQADGDADEAALLAYGLEVTPGTLRALRSVRDLSEVRKAEAEPARADTVEAGHPDADSTADAVRRAFSDRFVVPVELGGKHSAGSLLARDQDTGDSWLLKPGSGGQTPAAGASEDPSTQSRREAAFWHVADAWGLGAYLPRSDLVVVDGREYAAIHLLPWAYRNMDKLKEEDPGAPRAALHRYLKEGVLHRWALLDFVLGNPDRHAQNLMVRDGDVRLIDHGSAMAGEHFDPARDRNSFVPFYLRAWAPGRFSALDERDKLRCMPRVDRQSEEELRRWLDGLHAEDLDRVLLRYGVDPLPARERLAKVKAAAASEPVDLALNKLWVET